MLNKIIFFESGKAIVTKDDVAPALQGSIPSEVLAVKKGSPARKASFREEDPCQWAADYLGNSLKLQIPDLQKMLSTAGDRKMLLTLYELFVAGAATENTINYDISFAPGEFLTLAHEFLGLLRTTGAGPGLPNDPDPDQKALLKKAVSLIFLFKGGAFFKGTFSLKAREQLRKLLDQYRQAHTAPAACPFIEPLQERPVLTKLDKALKKDLKEKCKYLSEFTGQKYSFSLAKILELSDNAPWVVSKTYSFLKERQLPQARILHSSLLDFIDTLNVFFNKQNAVEPDKDLDFSRSLALALIDANYSRLPEKYLKKCCARVRVDDNFEKRFQDASALLHSICENNDIRDPLDLLRLFIE